MAVSKMNKLTLIAMKNDAGRIMRKLMWLGCVEIEREKNDGAAVTRGTLYASERQNAAKDAETLSEAFSILVRRGGTKRGMFSAPPTLNKRDFDCDVIGGSDYLSVCEKASRVIALDREHTQYEAECRTVEGQMASLSPWISYDMRLSEISTRYTRTVFGTVSASFDETLAAEALEKQGTEAVVEIVKKEKSTWYVSATFLKENEEKTLRALSMLGFSRIELADTALTPAEEISRLSDVLCDIKEKMSKALGEVDAMRDSCDDIAIALDMANTKANAAEAKQKLLCTERTVIISGWIPKEYVKDLEKTLAGDEVYYELEDPSPDDDVPVHLVNGKPAGYFESIVEMYSPPAYGTFDPTRIMMVFFFIIFGMMLADVIYGLMITFGCLFIAKKANVSRGVKNMCNMFAVCGISCIIWGIIFGSYLGDLPAQFMKNMFGIDIKVWAAVDILNDAIVFLVLSLAMGAIHMLAGMAIRFYVLCKNGQVFSAVFDEGSWFVLFLGAGLYFIVPTAGIIVAGTGVLMLILTQGREAKNPVMKLVKGIGSLYSLVNYASDLLSYSRIMALGLSSAVVASVFNVLATMGGFTVPGIIIFIVVILVGHILNLAINLLGTFVHTSRLQYVEFFGKFFEDGGRPFRPLKPDITHSSVVSSEGENK